MKPRLKEPARNAGVFILKFLALSRTDNKTLICPDCGIREWQFRDSSVVFPHCNEAPHEPTGRLCVAVIFYTIISSDFSVMFVTFIIADTVDYQPEMR